jgi:hypothetical protein
MTKDGKRSSFVICHPSNLEIQPKDWRAHWRCHATLWLIEMLARIQEGDVARMAKLFMLTGAQTRVSNLAVASNRAR